MTNASMRKRLGIKEKNYPMASRIMSDTVKAGLVKSYGDKTSKKTSKYVPFWA